MRLGHVRSRVAFDGLRRGTRARRGAVSVTFVPATDAGAGEPDRPRVAFAIGRRTGAATVRNRVRRRLRAAMGELGPAPGDYLLGGGTRAATMPYSALRDDLAAALAAVGALTAESRT